MTEFEQKLSEIIRARCQGHLPSVGAERFLHDAAQELIGCLEKEFVSKDLEEELERFAKLYPQENAGSYRNLITLARHFANWQRKKDETEIDRACKTADNAQYQNAWKDCHDTMMKDAVNVTLSGCWNDYDMCMLENILDDEYCPLSSEQISWLKSLKERRITNPENINKRRC